MKSILSRKDFYELRNQLYGRLVEEKELKDNDNNFILIEDIICETINIDWESKMKTYSIFYQYLLMKVMKEFMILMVLYRMVCMQLIMA